MSRVQVGQRFGRYTVIRHTAPTQTSSGARASVMVRCVCGVENVVLEAELKRGRHGGCSSKNCYRRWHHGEELEPLTREAMRQVYQRYAEGGADAVREWLGLDAEVRSG
ncbi:MAG: hypothetical protein JJ863_21445 [Deltaproteobacteria bacterium]|nr:hypothetical protein [Deltaproteobacteria bacterium]